MPDPSYTQVILDHYRQEAALHGRDASSTMRDEITRGREVASVLRVIDWLLGKNERVSSILDIGCGNGYLLEAIRARQPSVALAGLEYTPDMVAIARERAVERCEIVEGDVRKLPFEAARWDAVVTERCIINVMDQAHQADSLREVARVLRPGGYYLCIEAFADGLAQLNEARTELGLEANVVPHHNLWFDKDWFLATIAPDFEVVDVAAEHDPTLPTPNFLSSHYFVSRALYPAVTKREVLYNTHLVKFLSFLPPMGNYAAIQFWLLRKR